MHQPMAVMLAMMVVVVCLSLDAGAQTRLDRRKAVVVQILSDQGDLTAARRAAVGECRTLRQLQAAHASIRREQLVGLPVGGARAFQYLEMICRFGPRVSGSAGMRKQQRWLIRHFRNAGGDVRSQLFNVRHPLTGSRVTMNNLVVQWHPQRMKRILLCAHYDTRPFPDNDPDPAGRRGVFIGANDGASGVAVLCELAHHMKQLNEKQIGVDFVLFDGEEFVFDGERDPYFLGSDFFARSYRRQPPRYRYVAGLLLDMVGDEHLQIYKEKNSVKHAGRIVDEIWAVAKQLKVAEFKDRVEHEINDDHIPLNTIAGIPTCDLIDFDYPRPGLNYWHTRQDTPDKCSDVSLGRVGSVVLGWLKRQQ